MKLLVTVLLLFALASQSAIKFNGDSTGTQLVNVGTGASLDNMAPCTIACWLQLNGTNLTTTQRLFSKSVSSSAIIFAAVGPNGGATGSNSLRFSVAYSVATLLCTTDVSAFTVGKLHHVAVTWDGSLSTNGVKFYVDGVENTSRLAGNTDAVGTRNSDATADGVIGNSIAKDRCVNGYIGEVAVWTNVLTSASISTIAKPRLSRMPLMRKFNDTLVGYWPLDDGPNGGTVNAATGMLKDYSSRHNNGYASNSPTWISIPISYP